MGNAWRLTLRVYQIVPLRAIEFANEEIESGLRNQFDAGEMLSGMFTAHGQVKQGTFENSIAANLVVVREFSVGAGEMVVDITDGSEWMISQESFSRCGLGLGDKNQHIYLAARQGRGEAGWTASSLND